MFVYVILVSRNLLLTKVLINFSLKSANTFWKSLFWLDERTLLCTNIILGLIFIHLRVAFSNPFSGFPYRLSLKL